MEIMKKGIIFDMDGTLWDSAENVAASWTKVLEGSAYQREITKEDMYRVMGKTMDLIADELFFDVPQEIRYELLERCAVYENEYLRQHGGILYPNLRKTMEQLKQDYELYIVSNCQSGYIEAFLDYYGFSDLFLDIECYGNNNKKKGENISFVCDRNKLDAAIYVGDIEGDYLASKEAGILFIHASYGFGKVDETLPKITSLDELPEIVGQVFDAYGEKSKKLFG